MSVKKSPSYKRNTQKVFSPNKGGQSLGKWEHVPSTLKKLARQARYQETNCNTSLEYMYM